MGLFINFFLLFTTSLYAKSLDDRLQGLELNGLEAQTQKRLENIVERHNGGNVRVESCPLKSDRYQDILGKVQTLHTLFKNSCLDSDQSRMNDILTSAQNIQNSLDQLRDQTRANSTDGNNDANSLNDLSYSGSDGTTVNGDQIATVFNGINSVFMGGDCDFDKGSFLNQTADIVQSFAQMGLLVPNQNGLVVAGGGLAISSILRAIDNIFTKRFDFANIEDRQTFIKLNCGFYDLRREIEKTGMMDVPTKEHEKALKEAKDIHREIRSKLKKNAKNKKTIKTIIEKAKKEFAENRLGFLSDFEKELQKGASIVEIKTDSGGEALKLQVIYEMSKLSPKVSPMLTDYREELEENSLFNDLFQNLLKKFQQQQSPLDFENLVEKDPKDFFAKENAKLQFHFGRLLGAVKTKKKSLLKEWEKETTIDGLTVKKYLARLEKNAATHKKTLQKKQKQVATVISRVERILSYEGYRGSDQGTDSLVNILDQYEKIAAQIYGEWGQEFMMYTTHTSHDQNEQFLNRYEKFQRQHLHGDQIPPRQEQSQIELISACQNAVPYRRNWKRADALAQQGYDFISANKELFFSDVSDGFFVFNSDFEELRYHFKSAHYASLILQGVDVPQEYIDEYIKPQRNYNYNSSRDRVGPINNDREQRKHKRFIGKAMLDVSQASQKAGKLQQLIETYRCSKVMADSE